MAGQPTPPNVPPPEISPYFWGGYVRGGWLTSHDIPISSVVAGSAHTPSQGLKLKSWSYERDVRWHQGVIFLGVSRRNTAGFKKKGC